MSPQEEAVVQAIQARDSETLSSLLAANPALADTRTDAGVSALMLALYTGQRRLARAIADHRDGLDIFEAAALGLCGHIERSLEMDPDAAMHVSADGMTPLHFAARFDQAEATALLLERGAAPDHVSENPLAFTPLHAAIAGASLESAELLLDAGAFVDARQGDGLTSLMAAAATGQIEMIELLIDHGANREMRNQKGLRAAEIAVDQGFDEIADILD
ncbi:ankyrin repeat domain-containing protein [Natronospira bacteriovora]|uniref:Ankyrin repeat domain-containing protein n=1 Tax=Natronospira bacteriovora TaxID=3069753 RepID=A0ABU0W4D2_9GAMM|nr:ankyrin repeat domain-containing protein [Natronospira sp. AB-CW4]MDQ2068877.1 ankyrin repeat domain-containing protein [Natronospira sp. AB-CW4]